jgi:hypothetical protein
MEHIALPHTIGGLPRSFKQSRKSSPGKNALAYFAGAGVSKKYSITLTIDEKKLIDFLEEDVTKFWTTEN